MLVLIVADPKMDDCEELKARDICFSSVIVRKGLIPRISGPKIIAPNAKFPLITVAHTLKFFNAFPLCLCCRILRSRSGSCPAD
jgi:hypothetical protein